MHVKKHCRSNGFRCALGLVLLAGLSACGGSSSSGSPGASSSSSSSASSSSSSSSSSGGDCIAADAGDGYCLVWRDEFGGDQVDSRRWSFERNCYGGGNNEAQCYVDSPANVWVEGGYLHLQAIREDVAGPGVGDDDPAYDPADRSGTGTYSSGRLRSKGKGDWRYGRFEIRAKLPWGQGTWPAIWMLPTDGVYGGWASSGEIDIMEAVNLRVGGERRIHGTLHFGDNWPNNVYAGDAYLLPGDANPADDFHTYAVEWEEGEIRWYVDGDHYATQTQNGWYSAKALDEPVAPFDQRFHLILNLAVGGDWAGNVNDTGIDESVFPQVMLVDYVRVFECRKGPDTGRGCASSDGDFISNPGVTPPTPVDPGDGSEFVVFNGMVTPPYEWFTWTEEGTVDYQLAEAGDTYGTVAQVTFNTDRGIGFFQSAAPVDFSAFREISLDVRIVEDARAIKDPLVLRADCVYPCSSGDYPLGYPALNTWTRYSVPLAELAAAGLDLSRVNTPLVLSPRFGNQRGVVLQLDNVRLLR
jgi:beta-glucanase (GH16 family)